MNKHAYCILAHTDEYCLMRLIEAIDDSRNEIFVHIDKKSQLQQSEFSAKHTIIHFVPKDRRHDVRWGTYSQIETEFEILSFAKEHGDYEYYHLISGQDLPLHSQNYIHEYFARLPVGTNLIGFKDSKLLDKINVKKRIVPFHFFKNYYRNKNKFVQYSCRFFEEIMNHIQLCLGLKINYSVKYRKGCNWVSLHSDFVKYVISKKDYIDNILEKSIICDELFLQTLIYNSDFKDSVLDYQDEYNGCMRAIDWSRGNPYIWRISDFNQLINSNALFARKFSSQTDKGIIDKIVANTLV